MTPVISISPYWLNSSSSVASGSQVDPRTIGLADGRVLTVWTDPNNSFLVGPSAGNDIVGRISDHTGAFTGQLFQVNTAFVNGDESNADIVADPYGGFLLVGEQELNGNRTIFWEQYDIDLNSVDSGSLPAISQVFSTNDVPSLPSVAYSDTINNGEDFVLAFARNDGGGTETNAVRIDFNTANAGAEFEVGSRSTSNVPAHDLDVAVLDNGSIVTVYMDSDAIQMRMRFTITPEVILQGGLGNSIVTKTIEAIPGDVTPDPRITALGNGGFAVAYDERVSAGIIFQSELKVAIFDSSGDTIQGPTLVDVSGGFTEELLSSLDIIRVDDDTFYVLWARQKEQLGEIQVRGQLFNNDGSSAGLEQIIGTAADYEGDLGMTSDGRIIVTYAEASGNGNGTDIRKVFLDPREAGTFTEGTDLDDYLTAASPGGTVHGGDGDDKIEGSNQRDILVGQRNNDELRGNGGNDDLFGNLGDDILEGGGGDDFLSGLGDNDILRGGPGRDTLSGGAGTDLADYTEETDNWTFNLINQTATNGNITETIEGIENFDLGSGNNTFTGDTFNNVVNGNDGFDTIYGGRGNDTLRGHLGRDALYGELGNDTLIHDDDEFLASQIFDGGNGFDTILLSGLLNDIFHNVASDDVTSIEVLEFDSTPVSLPRGVFVAGDQFGDGLSQQLQVRGNTVSDNVQTFHVVMGQAANVDLSGLQFSNWSSNDVVNVSGRSDGNIITTTHVASNVEGKGGNDTIISGLGSDIINGGDDVDTASYANSSAGVVANLTAAYGQLGDATGDTYIAIENLTGSDHRDILQGNGGNNTLNGGGSFDVLYGYEGDDVYVVDNSSDAVIEATGEGFDNVFSSVDYVIDSDQEIESAILTGTAVVLRGDDSGNQLFGNDVTNVIDGRGGTDFMLGNGGADIFQINLEAGATDVVGDFSKAEGDRMAFTGFNPATTFVNQASAISFEVRDTRGTIDDLSDDIVQTFQLWDEYDPANPTYTQGALVFNVDYYFG